MKPSRMTRDGSAQRAEDIVARRRAGETLAQIGRAHGLTKVRVFQILQRWLLPEEREELQREVHARRGANGLRGHRHPFRGNQYKRALS